MRVGDIRTLKLDQIHWEDSTIDVTQSKTDLPLSLPLTSEVGEALIDYLKSGRPQSAHREVFLKVKPPFDPFTGNNLHHIVGIGGCWQEFGFALLKSGGSIRYATL
jgi:integrase